MLISMPSATIHIPTRLIIEQHTRPLAIGIYTLMVRSVLYLKQAVQLSHKDIMNYDPAINRGALIRSLEKLDHHGWIVRRTGKKGMKVSYLPTWGFVSGQSLPWNPKDEAIPEGVPTVTIHSKLLDHYIGVIAPRPSGNSWIDRAHEPPLLTLNDVGIYLMASAGYPASTPNLAKHELIVDGKVQTLA